jgi:hypothetical protein
VTDREPSEREYELVEQIGRLARALVDKPEDHVKLWQDLDKRLAELYRESPHDLDD